MIKLKLSSLWGALALFQYALAVCPANSTTFLGPVSTEYCICYSGQYWTGSTCASVANCVSLPSGANVETGVAITSTTVDVATDTVSLAISFPAYKSRLYASILLGNCTVCTTTRTGCYSSLSALTMQTPNDNSCQDKWLLTAPLSGLQSCGWVLTSGVSYNNGTYQQLASQLRVIYQENIDLATTYTRSMSVVLPVVLFFEQNYTAPAITDVSVYSNYSISAAVVIRNVSTDATSSIVDVTYMAQFPYQVRGFNTGLTVTGMCAPARPLHQHAYTNFFASACVHYTLVRMTQLVGCTALIGLPLHDLVCIVSTGASITIASCLHIAGANAGSVTANIVNGTTLAAYPLPPYNAPNCLNSDYSLTGIVCGCTLFCGVPVSRMFVTVLHMYRSHPLLGLP